MTPNHWKGEINQWYFLTYKVLLVPFLYFKSVIVRCQKVTSPLIIENLKFIITFKSFTKYDYSTFCNLLKHLLSTFWDTRTPQIKKGAKIEPEIEKVNFFQWVKYHSSSHTSWDWGVGSPWRFKVSSTSNKSSLKFGMLLTNFCSCSHTQGWESLRQRFISSFLGFYKPTILKLHPPLCMITARATVPGYFSTILAFMILIQINGTW